ncbi:MAG: quinone-dependent dihydroorotate dehydrogenase [Gammaproteobacteria bacterium]|nr:quinone-dependent dihydroorotate dehydrogenase [Gammaproteobacteria bacterium]
MYPAARSALFKLDAEVAHELSIKQFSAMPRAIAKALFNPCVADKPVELLGLRFPNPVGLAAGLDKNGECIQAFDAMGFGFVEIGTVTPRPQPGNEKPRLFRLPEHEAIINRMGFNNHGVDALVERAKKARKSGKLQAVLGINIGKNKDTPNENANDDYLICLRKVYVVADYVTVNLSSPNTPGLRDLQHGEAMDELLTALKAEQAKLEAEHGRYVPVLVKIAPDLTDEEVADVAERLQRTGIDGVIATNTTLSRDAVAGHQHADEAGGLSGAPVQQRSTEVVRLLRQNLGKEYPIIAVGGVASKADAAAKKAAGADLVQVYTGFIYQGPKLIADCVAAWN